MGTGAGSHALTMLALLMTSAVCAWMPTGAATNERTVQVLLEDHAPIIIDGDLDLLLPDSLSSNGVRSGLGTRDDPYIIEGWRIRYAEHTLDSAIQVGGTSKFLVVRNIEFASQAQMPPPAVAVARSSNIRIEMLSFNSNGIAVAVDTGRNVTLSDLTVRGDTDVKISNIQELTLQNLEFSGSSPHLEVRSSEGSLENVSFQNTDPLGVGGGWRKFWAAWGAEAFSSKLRLHHASFHGFRSGAGLGLFDSEVTISGSSFHDNREGLYSNNSRFAIEESELARNERGALVLGSCKECRISHSAFIENKVDIANHGSSEIVLEANRWEGTAGPGSCLVQGAVKVDSGCSDRLSKDGARALPTVSSLVGLAAIAIGATLWRCPARANQRDRFARR